MDSGNLAAEAIKASMTKAAIWLVVLGAIIGILIVGLIWGSIWLMIKCL